MHNKPIAYENKIQTPKNNKKIEVNNVDHKKKKANDKPKR